MYKYNKFLPQSGIYAIICVKTCKFYIGQSNNVRKRIWEHDHFLKNGTHCNPYLKAAWIKYGENSFRAIVLEYCNRELMENRERFWISFYKSNQKKFGYNIYFGSAGNGFKKSSSEETKLKISKALKGRKITEKERENRAAFYKANPNFQKDKVIPQEVRLKISNSLLKRNKSLKDKRRKSRILLKLINIQNGEIFNGNFLEFCEKYPKTLGQHSFSRLSLHKIFISMGWIRYDLLIFILKNKWVLEYLNKWVKHDDKKFGDFMSLTRRKS